MPRYDTVLLDADNTLFDFDAAEEAALARALGAWSCPLDPQVLSRYLEINRDLWAAFDRGEVEQDHLLVERFRLLGEALGRPWDPPAVNDAYLTALGEESRLLPGAEALCRSLKEAGCRLALATNGAARVQLLKEDWPDEGKRGAILAAVRPYFDTALLDMALRQVRE